MAALRVLVLNSEITALRAQLRPLEQTRDGFAAREEQLRQALGEITETSTDEERNAVSSAVDTFEQERSANAAEIARIQGEIDTRSAEIARLEAEQTPPPASNPAVSNSDTRNNDHHERSFVPMNNTTERRWFGLTYAERDALNELDINFLQLTMDGYMVGGYMAVPNSVLMDDSDLQLATSILQALASSIAKAIDKSIWFGTGEKMPVGITRRRGMWKNNSRPRA